MRIITSNDNKIIKLCRQLTVKKYRDKYDMYLIEGENLLEEARKTGAQVEYVLVREDYSKTAIGFEKITYGVAGVVFDKLVQTQTSQGILAVVKKPIESELSSLKAKKVEGNFIVLDRLQDPGNIGTIIRTADAAGYSLMIVMQGTADIYSPKVIRAAAGSVFRLPVVFVKSNGELLDFIKASGKKSVATCFDTNKYYYDEDLSDGIALIIGNEGNGISTELIEKADLKVKLPMSGNIESLNASVAAGILMYEAVRCRKN